METIYIFVFQYQRSLLTITSKNLKKENRLKRTDLSKDSANELAEWAQKAWGNVCITFDKLAKLIEARVIF